MLHSSGSLTQSPNGVTYKGHDDSGRFPVSEHLVHAKEAIDSPEMLGAREAPWSSKGWALDCVLFHTWNDGLYEPLLCSFSRNSCRLRAMARPMFPSPIARCIF